MKGYEGSKALLPLVPLHAPYEGEHPLILEILRALPPGPRALVLHHHAEAVMERTRGLGLGYYRQDVLDGTGGALLVARPFIAAVPEERLLITMGDIPLVRKETYEALLDALFRHAMVVLGFTPRDRKQYGLLRTEGDRVIEIIEWKYWKDFPDERLSPLTLCNAGVYAARIPELLGALRRLEGRPHRIRKEIQGEWHEFEEFFLTDLVACMGEEGLSVGYLTADEDEVMGVDDPPALERAQTLYAGRRRHTARL